MHKTVVVLPAAKLSAILFLKRVDLVFWVENWVTRKWFAAPMRSRVRCPSPSRDVSGRQVPIPKTSLVDPEVALFVRREKAKVWLSIARRADAVILRGRRGRAPI